MSQTTEPMEGPEDVEALRARLATLQGQLEERRRQVADLATSAGARSRALARPRTQHPILWLILGLMMGVVLFVATFIAWGVAP